jgi:hypothetical protein
LGPQGPLMNLVTSSQTRVQTAGSSRRHFIFSPRFFGLGCIYALADYRADRLRQLRLSEEITNNE